jgi:hypothetical protein
MASSEADQSNIQRTKNATTPKQIKNTTAPPKEKLKMKRIKNIAPPPK